MAKAKPPRPTHPSGEVPFDIQKRRTFYKLGGFIALPMLATACGGGDSSLPPETASGETADGAIPQPKASAPLEPKAHKLAYAAAATAWESEALPIGNGRVGAMLFGGTARERIQFNEESLWGGSNNYDSSNYDLGVNGFGSYLNFGELNIQFVPEITLSSPGGQGQTYWGEDIWKSIDGDTQTKWCIEYPGNLVTWQASLSHATIIASYTLTSANDVPDRDPKSWTFEGSNNGSSWTRLDSRSLAAPFESRFLAKTFTFNNTKAYKHYRFSFTPRSGVSHFQVAEIALAGLSTATPIYVSSPTGDDYGRSNPNPGEDIFRTVDGINATKWCVGGPGSQVAWQVDLGAWHVFSSYSLTSAGDTPERDPKDWVLAGSHDGLAWTALDTRSLAAPFESRLLTKTFAFTNSTSYRYYRLSFTSRAGVSHFQVAAISMSGPSFNTATQGNFVAAYKRELDLAQGLHQTKFIRGGVTVTREAFATNVDDVMVLRYTADQAGAFTGTVALSSGQAGAAVTASGTQLSFSGTLGNNLKHAGAVRIYNTGGTVALSGSALVFTACDALTVIVDARTNYQASYGAGWRGADPLPRVNTAISAAGAKPYATLRTSHANDFSALMTATSVDWGNSPADATVLPVNLRLKRYAANGADPELEQAMFAYGRYLLVSCSRAGGLPANLQGLWNNTNSPEWASDYHNNINVQMNYWGAEVTSLSALHLPLVDFVEASLVPCRNATRAAFGSGVRGWTARTSQSIFGGNGWEWNNVASAWYAQHLYEHYAFTQDRAYLGRVYPIIKEICEFWQDRLWRRWDGKLVAPNGWSPEHGPVEDGVMYDQQIIWDLFQNYLDAARALAVDATYQGTVAAMQADLAPNKIGSWGQLQEWQDDRDDRWDLHRHTSHLFAVYPGRQITPRGTPAFAAAAMVSLKARCNETSGVPFTAATMSGDSRRSWTWPWRAALFARLGDGARAATMIRGLLTFNTLDNLFCNHPPFQMDGNFGITGAIPEMLLQSHAGEIHLLPACPAEWHTGSFSGLRARGGYKISCSWSAGQVTAYSIVADRVPVSGPVSVRVNGQVVQVTPQAG